MNPPSRRNQSLLSWYRFNMFTNRLKQNSENETKFVQDRINLAERNVAELTLGFGTYSRKAARLRDVGDELTTILQQYANAETVNQSFSNGLNRFASSLNTINNYGDKRVQYIDNKVVAQLQPYETTCKNMREGVKNIYITKDKEVLRQRQLDRIKERNPRNRQQIVEAESELVQAKSEVARTIHNLEDKLLTFERQKLHDLKEILLDFVCTEIGYHSKAISLLTEAYTNIDAINIDTDVEKFKASLRDPKDNKAKQPLSKHSQSLGAINTAGLNTKKPQKQKSVSEEVLNENEDESEASETEFTDSDSDPPAVTKKKPTRKFVQ
ncbi:CBY1-interacting BAR domain-containing protein 1 isoform X2 [Atheta coriaria]|uniref:CBY1-interacting BAR domain-containing protein 1 isoform X2 n=1 Tax=Dalotia coriaria TaxID=877792 RepID=UPI0031F43915